MANFKPFSRILCVFFILSKKTTGQELVNVSMYPLLQTAEISGSPVVGRVHTLFTSVNLLPLEKKNVRISIS
jgi:hypothetical protein